MANKAKTINVWNTLGTKLFNYSFENYNPEYVELEGFVRNSETLEVDDSYVWSDRPESSQAELNKELVEGLEFVLQIMIPDDIQVDFEQPSTDVNAKTLMKQAYQFLTMMESVQDNRVNARTTPLDVAGFRVKNLAEAVQDYDAIPLIQMRRELGNIPGQVEQAEQVVAQAESIRDDVALSKQSVDTTVSDFNTEATAVLLAIEDGKTDIDTKTTDALAEIDTKITTVDDKVAEAEAAADRAEAAFPEGSDVYYKKDSEGVMQALSTEAVRKDLGLSDLENRLNEYKLNTVKRYAPSNFSWQGELIADDGTVIKSETELFAGFIGSLGAPVVQTGDRTELVGSQSSLGTCIYTSGSGGLYTNKIDVSTRITYNNSGTYCPVMGMGPTMGVSARRGFALRIYTSDNKMRFYATSNNSTWNIAEVTGTKEYVPGNDYNIRLYHDISTGSLQIQYSEDTKHVDDPTKVWQVDIDLTGKTAPIARQTNNYTYLFIGADFIDGLNDSWVSPTAVFHRETRWYNDDVPYMTDAQVNNVVNNMEPLYLYAGLDDLGNVTLEGSAKEDGSDLRYITGVRRVVLKQHTVDGRTAAWNFVASETRYSDTTAIDNKEGIASYGMLENVGYKSVWCSVLIGRFGGDGASWDIPFINLKDDTSQIMLHFHNGGGSDLHLTSQVRVHDTATTNFANERGAYIQTGTPQYTYYGLPFGNKLLTGSSSTMKIVQVLGKVK